ncbi:MAG TPA: serine hydrolase domain-containing protein [Bryobacteraceae bacterium]|nr:serine hydrolase domain-containing protein [Bryobacteraceae bacterium]
MRVKIRGAAKALVATVTVCVNMIPATAHKEAQSTAQAAAATKDGRAEIDAHVAEWLKESDVPSVAVAYIQDRKVAWTEVYGEQSPGVAATEKTLYNVASLTKPITAETILRLASARKLSLDESMSQIWVDPDIRDDPYSKLLTPRLCLSHQTGFANWRRMTGGVLKIRWKPGTQTGYSGEGYNYVGTFVERKFARPFDALAQEMVFDPIGMKETSYTAKNWYAGRLAMPHGPKAERPIDPVATKWNGADLLRTTIGDYAKFVVSVMRDEGLTEAIAAERATITRDMVKPEDLEKLCREAGELGQCRVTAGMGLGWEVEIVNRVKILDHDGSDWGVRTSAMFVPSQGIGVVVFTNGENGAEVIRKVVEALYPNKLYVARM